MTRSPFTLRRGFAVIVALSSMTTTAFAATQFVPQAVHSTGNVGQFASIALGPQDDPRIGYWSSARQELKLATKTSGVWALETAESTAALGLHTSLAFSAGDPRISYYDATHGDLKYASRTAGVWTLETVDTAGVVGLYTSLKLDSAGNPHISYYDQTQGDLKYASKSGGTWTVETVNNPGNDGRYTSLALNASDVPYISSWSEQGGLVLATKAFGAWGTYLIDLAAGGVVGEFSSIALDGAGNPHISYFDRTRGRLKLAIQNAGVWTLETIPDTLGGVVGQHTSLALDSLGDARISYYDVSNADLKFARFLRTTNPDTAYWQYSLVDGAGNVGQFTSIVIDTAGDAAIAYWDASNQNLKYARNIGGSWIFDVVDAPGDVGQFASLTLSGGAARISYWDTSRQDLKLASLSGNGWSSEIADDGGNLGQYASLALNAQGDPFLSYWDNTYGVGNLRAASRVGGVWTSELVDAAGNVGEFTSIAVDAQGDPRISYYDVTNGDLKFASRNGGLWTLETVDVAGDVGQYTSLALDAQGNPRISYYDATNGDLKFASRGAGGGWTLETADAPGTVGQYTSLALDGQGEPRISYYDAGNGDLKFASRSGGSWTPETVDVLGDVGRHTSLALARGPSAYRATDAVGDPRITYYDATSRDLKFASRTAGVWTFEPIDAAGDVGQFTSLAVDARGNCRVGYYDVTNGDLKYAIQHYPDLPMWAYPGAFRAGADSIRTRSRTTTLRWMRDPVMEGRADFGGYRIYRVFYSPDTARLELIRRFSVNSRDSTIMWHFPLINESTPLAQRIATFMEPDSNGTFFKRCRRDSLGQCYSPGDSIIVLIPPPGPHDGFRTWYAITYEARNILSNDYIDMHVADAIGCPDSNRATCPNLNNKARNLTGPIEPTLGPTQNLQKVAVVPNPFRSREVWDRAAAHEVHFINLPAEAKIRIYTVAGDLVAELQHKDTVRDFERWDLKNGHGRDVSSGIYIYRVEAANFFAQDRFVVIR